MELNYKKAELSDIDEIVELKIKQNKDICQQDKIPFEQEEITRESIKKILLQELNKTIHFFIAIDKNENKAVACSGVVIYQMVPSSIFLNGLKTYVTSVYTEDNYRCKGIQNKLMEMILEFLKKKECTEVELDADNPYAVKLYEKFGFKKYDIKYRLDL